MQQDLPENNVVRNVAPKRIKLPLTYSHNEQYYGLKYISGVVYNIKLTKRIKSSLKRSNNVMMTIES
jgi:hypothetical protein